MYFTGKGVVVPVVSIKGDVSVGGGGILSLEDVILFTQEVTQGMPHHVSMRKVADSMCGVLVA